MPEFAEGRLTFRFPEDMVVKKYDETNMYRNNISSICGGNKGVDFIAIDENSAWFIEVKDFRLGDRKDIGIPLNEEIERKFRDSLFGVLAMRAGIKTTQDEVEFGHSALVKSIKIIFHLEDKVIVGVPRRLRALNIEEKLKKSLRPFSSLIRVCDSGNLEHIPWTVTQNY